MLPKELLTVCSVALPSTPLPTMLVPSLSRVQQRLHSLKPRLPRRFVETRRVENASVISGHLDCETVSSRVTREIWNTEFRGSHERPEVRRYFISRMMQFFLSPNPGFFELLIERSDSCWDVREYLDAVFCFLSYLI